VNRKPCNIIGEQGAESTPIALHVWHELRRAAFAARLPGCSFMRERAILDVVDAIGARQTRTKCARAADAA